MILNIRSIQINPGGRGTGGAYEARHLRHVTVGN